VNVLAYTSPARGHLYPLMPALIALAARGARVHVRTLASAVGEVQRAGLHAAPIDPRIERIELDDHRARTPIGALRRTFDAWGRRAPLELDDLHAAIDDARPDVLVIDTTTFGARAVAGASGLPWIESRPFLLDDPVPGQPPFGLGLPPMGGPAGRARNAAARQLVGAVESRLQLPMINAARAAAGLAPLPTMAEARHRGTRTLAFTAPPFDHVRAPNPKVAFVGPCPWDPSPGSTDAVPALDGRPVAIVTCSSEFQDDTPIVAASLAALGGTHQVIATAPGADPGAFDVPDGSSVHGLLSHEPLLPHASVVVCHGGMGITQRALAHGVPVVVVPWGRDQRDVAVHVARAQSGVVVPRRRCRPEVIMQAVRDAERCRAGAARIAAAFAAAGGATAAADAIAAAAGYPAGAELTAPADR
jgi:MGT family glycosyltransferase